MDMFDVGPAASFVRKRGSEYRDGARQEPGRSACEFFGSGKFWKYEGAGFSEFRKK